MPFKQWKALLLVFGLLWLQRTLSKGFCPLAQRLEVSFFLKFNFSLFKGQREDTKKELPSAGLIFPHRIPVTPRSESIKSRSSEVSLTFPCMWQRSIIYCLSEVHEQEAGWKETKMQANPRSNWITGSGNSFYKRLHRNMFGFVGCILHMRHFKNVTGKRKIKT